MSLLLYTRSAQEDGFAPLLRAASHIAEGSFVLVATRRAPSDTKPHPTQDWVTLPDEDPHGVGARLLELYAARMHPAVALFAGDDASALLRACRPHLGFAVLLGEGEDAPDLRVTGPETLMEHTETLRQRLPFEVTLDASGDLDSFRHSLRARGPRTRLTLFWQGPLSALLEDAVRCALAENLQVEVQVGLRDGLAQAPHKACPLLLRWARQLPPTVAWRVVAEEGVAIPLARWVSRGLGRLSAGNVPPPSARS